MIQDWLCFCCQFANWYYWTSNKKAWWR